VAADHGRPLHHITHRLEYAALIPDIENVLARVNAWSARYATDAGKWYIVRINPYRSIEGEPDGVVLTFFDHTAQHQVRGELREAMSAAESANLAKGTFLSNAVARVPHAAERDPRLCGPAPARWQARRSAGAEGRADQGGRLASRRHDRRDPELRQAGWRP
jgi:hypothetical protein